MLSAEQKRILSVMMGLVALTTVTYLAFPVATLWNTAVYSSIFTGVFALFSITKAYLSDDETEAAPSRERVVPRPNIPLRASPSIERRYELNQLSDFEISQATLIRKFRGQTEERHDLQRFEEWYPQYVIETLMSGQPNPSGALRVVFSNPAKFSEELTQFKMMLTTLGRPGIFVCMEPGVGQNHYIIGVIHRNNLLLINPVGTTQHQDFYEVVAKLRRDNIFIDMILSTTALQKDPNGLVSCGPLCTQLSHLLSNSNIETFFASLSAQAQLHPSRAFRTADITPLLADPLRAISQASGADYQAQMVALRQRHLGELFQVCKDKTSTNACNAYFDNAVNSNESVLLRNLVLSNATIIDMLDMPEYKALEAQYPRQPRARVNF